MTAYDVETATSWAVIDRPYNYLFHTVGKGKNRVKVHRNIVRVLQRRFQIRRHRIVTLEPILGTRPIARGLDLQQLFRELSERCWNARIVDRVTAGGGVPDDRFFLRK